MLDKTFITEIRKTANGDNSREYRIAFMKELREISNALSNRYEYNNCIKKYGRAKVALCTACTIIRENNRHEKPQIVWANEVMALWTNQVPDFSISAATINIHPAILSDNSSFLRQITTIK